MTQPAYRRHERLRRLRLSFRAKLAQVRGLEADVSRLQLSLQVVEAQKAHAARRGFIFGMVWCGVIEVFLLAIGRTWK